MTLPDSWERRLGIAEWEPRDMTICIAAICDDGNTIVLASDTEVGIGFTATYIAGSKWGPLYKNWFVGIAGTLSHATDVLTRARRLEPEPPISFDVRASLEKAYRESRMARVEADHLANR